MSACTVLGSSLAYGRADFPGGLGARRSHVLRIVMIAAPAGLAVEMLLWPFARRLVQRRCTRLGCRIGVRLDRRVRPALPHPGDRSDERAVARDRAGARRATRRCGPAAGRAATTYSSTSPGPTLPGRRSSTTRTSSPLSATTPSSTGPWRAKVGTPLHDGVPTSHYTAVQFTCHADIVGDPEAKAGLLRRRLAALVPRATTPRRRRPVPYGRMLSGIRGLRLEVTEARGKFKYDDHKPVEHRTAAADRLTARAQGLDVPTARQQRRRLDRIGPWNP
jgi:hypothetical protein